MYYKYIAVSENSYHLVSNYFLCPIDLGVVSECGDTFYPKFEELRYFTPLLRQIPPKDVEWSCYFSKVPKNARVLGLIGLDIVYLAIYPK